MVSDALKKSLPPSVQKAIEIQKQKNPPSSSGGSSSGGSSGGGGGGSSGLISGEGNKAVIREGGKEYLVNTITGTKTPINVRGAPKTIVYSATGGYSGTPTKATPISSVQYGNEKIPIEKVGQRLEQDRIERINTLVQKIEKKQREVRNQQYYSDLARAMSPVSGLDTEFIYQRKTQQSYPKPSQQTLRQPSYQETIMPKQGVSAFGSIQEAFRVNRLTPYTKEEKREVGEALLMVTPLPFGKTKKGVQILKKGAELGKKGAIWTYREAKDVPKALRATLEKIKAKDLKGAINAVKGNVIVQTGALTIGGLTTGTIAGKTTEKIGKWSLDKETKALIKQNPKKYAEAQIAIIRALEAENTGIYATSKETDVIKSAQSEFTQKARQEASSAGYTGIEQDKVVQKALEQQFLPQVESYYQGAGLSKEKAKETATNLVMKSQAPTSSWYDTFRFPLIGTPRQAAFEISMFTAGKGRVEKSAEEFWATQGYTGEEKKKRVDASLKYWNIQGSSEIFENVGVEAFSEFTGTSLLIGGAKKLGTKAYSFFSTKTAQQSVKKASQQGFKVMTQKEAFDTLFGEGFKRTAPVGFGEGFSVVTLGNKRRGREFSASQSIIGGGLGAITAGTFQGLNLGLTGKGSPFTARAVRFTGNVLDFPYEPLGDIVGGGARKALGLPSVAIKRTVRSGDIVGLGVTKARPRAFTNIFSTTQTKIKKAKPFSYSKSTPTKTQAGTLMEMPNINFKSNLNLPQFDFTPVGTIGETPSKTGKDDTKVIDKVPDIPTFTFTPSFTIDVPSMATVPTTTETSTYVPTITPLWRASLPILPFFGLPTSSGGAVRSVKGKKYVNELEAGRALLGELTGGNFFYTKKNSVFSQKKSKKKAKKKRI